tara:strand:- start:1541 stop:1849 length:309 start_codon:yes stop_codon:yes gene_type:complete
MVEERVYENAWLYEGKPFTSDDIGDFFGFVYRITNIQSGKQYIGRKYFYQKRKPRGGKRRLRLRVTGSDTMEALQNLIQIESYLEMQRSNEKSYPSIPDLEM